MIRNLLILVVIISLGVLTIPDEPVNAWEQSYDGPSHGDDHATAVARGYQGQVHVTGYSWSDQNSWDYVTIKYGSIGNKVWEKRYDGDAHGADLAEAIVTDGCGYVWVTGRSQGSGLDYDYLTIRHLPSGEIAEGWPQTYDGPEGGDDEACALAIDGDGNIYVTGRSYGGETNYDYLTIKYTTAGETLWVRRYDGEEHGVDEACALAVDGSGKVYVTGRSWGGDSDYDYVTIKYEPDGKTADGWPKIYDRGEENDEPRAIAVDDSGCVHVTGRSYTEEVGYDYVTIKYYPSGEYWVAVYDGPAHDEDEAEDIAIDPEGNVCVTGRSEGNYMSGYDYATIKYDPDGDVAEGWPQREGWAYTDHALAVAADDSGNVYVTGKSYRPASSYDYMTIMYEPDGDVFADTIWDGAGSGDDIPASLAVGCFNYVYMAGTSDGGETEKDFIITKLVEGFGGDINGDYETDVEDVVFLYDYLFHGGKAPDPLKRADVNCDEKIDIGDGVFLNNYLFRGGPPPCD